MTTEQKCKKLVEKAHCLGFNIFDEQLVGVKMTKIKTLINNPFYLGFMVLELWKLDLYRFYYYYFLKKYPEAMKLFTDTDSLMYWMETSALVQCALHPSTYQNGLDFVLHFPYVNIILWPEFMGQTEFLGNYSGLA